MQRRLDGQLKSILLQGWVLFYIIICISVLLLNSVKAQNLTFLENNRDLKTKLLQWEKEAPDSIRVKINALRSGDAVSKAYAIIELGKIGPNAKGAAIALFEAFLDQTTLTNLAPSFFSPLKTSPSHLAARTFMDIGEPALEPLSFALKDNNNVVRLRATEALANLVREKNISQFTERFIDALKDTISDVRCKMAYILGVIKDRRALEPLISALRDGDDEVRLEAVASLEKLDDRRTIEPLAAVLKDSNIRVRFVAAVVLGNYKDQRAVETLIEGLKEDLCFEGRQKAAALLGRIKDTRAVGPLISTIRDNLKREDMFVRSTAVVALADIGLIEPIIESLRDSSAEVRMSMAEALGYIKDRRGIESLIEALKDEDERVRNAAICSLAEMKDQHAIDPLIAKLNDKDPHTRWSAIESLGNIKDRRVIEALIGILKDTNNYWCSNKAAETLKKLTGKDYGLNHIQWQAWWAKQKHKSRL